MSFEIPFIRPVLPPAEIVAADVSAIVQSNWYTNFGPQEQRFRAEVSRFLGVGIHVVTFCNATVGLLGALSTTLQDAAPGGLVIVPSFTFAAGPQAIRWAGHHPLFIDIDPRTLQPSLEQAAAAIAEHGERIVAILFCNTFGIGADDIDGWEELAERHGLPLIVDSAAGFGSSYPDGTSVGTRGDCEVFSFHATKPFAIGEGGAVVTRDPELAEALRSFSNFGFGLDGSTRPGLNGKLQEINAAIGLRQLETIRDAVSERREVLSRYRAIFESEGIAQLVPHAEKSSVCFASVVIESRLLRDALLDRFRAAGVEARIYYSPVHIQPVFSHEQRSGALAVTDDVGARILALPVFQQMPDSAFHIIRSVVSETLRSSTHA